MDQVISSLLSKTYTKNQALTTIRLIREFLNYLFFDLQLSTEPSARIDQFLKSQSLDPDTSKEAKILYQLGDDFYKAFNPKNLTAQLKIVEEVISSIQEVIVHLPFEMPDEEVERMGVWFKKNLGIESLFNLNLDPSLIGGTALSYKGVYKDYSLKQIVAENKVKVIQMLVSFKQ